MFVCTFYNCKSILTVEFLKSKVLESAGVKLPLQLFPKVSFKVLHLMQLMHSSLAGSSMIVGIEVILSEVFLLPLVVVRNVYAVSVLGRDRKSVV